jgi:tetratricopeptide (TPR) repeat protein
MMIRVALPLIRAVALLAAAGSGLLAGGAQDAPRGQAGPKPGAGARTGAAALAPALQLAESGRCPEALPPLRQALAGQLTPSDRKYAALAGAKCAMALERTGEAIRFIESLGDGFQSDPAVLYFKTHLFSDLSVRTARELLLRAPGSVQARQLNAEALETQGKWSEAAAEYHKVLELEPSREGIHYLIGRLLLSQPASGQERDKLREQAKKEFEAEIALNERNPGAQFILAELARDEGRLDEAVQRFQKAATYDAGFGHAWIGLGRSLLAQDKVAEAIPALERAVQLLPDIAEAHYQLALAYKRAGRQADFQRESARHQETLRRVEKERLGLKESLQGADKQQ